MKGLFLDDERSVGDVTWVLYPTGVDWTVVRNKACCTGSYLHSGRSPHSSHV